MEQIRTVFCQPERGEDLPGGEGLPGAHRPLAIRAGAASMNWRGSARLEQVLEDAVPGWPLDRSSPRFRLKRVAIFQPPPPLRFSSRFHACRWRETSFRFRATCSKLRTQSCPPDDRCCELNSGGDVSCEFVVPRCEASPVPEPAEHAPTRFLRLYSAVSKGW